MQMMQAAAAGQCNQRMIVGEQAQVRSESKIKADISIPTLFDVYESIAFRLCSL
jgi:hypothetical protein